MSANSASVATSVFYIDDFNDLVDQSDAQFTIGELAAEFGISTRAIRLYEERGLIDPQRQGGQRFYTLRDRLTLEQILRAKRFGFTLTETGELLRAAGGQAGAPTLELSAAQCADQIERLARQRAEIETAITDLESLLTSMRR